jgi:hypothetical protein
MHLRDRRAAHGDTDNVLTRVTRFGLDRRVVVINDAVVFPIN